MSFMNTTRSKYAKLNQSTASDDKSKVSQLVFPSNLLDVGRGTGHFILFDFNEIVGTSFKTQVQQDSSDISSGFKNPVVYERNSGSIRKHMNVRHRRNGESIALMMPNSVTTNYGANWDNIELGSAAQMLRTAMNIDNLKLSDVKNYAIEQLKSGVTGAIQAVTPINAADAAELFTGSISNPYVEVLFKGMTNREFPISFVFKPKNEEESRIAKEIVRRFKFHMSPEFKYRQTESAYLLHPSTVDVTYMVIGPDGQAQRNQWLWRMSTCAIVNVAEDVTSDDGYTIHDNDAPTVIKLDLSLVELEPLHKGRFADSEDSF